MTPDIDEAFRWFRAIQIARNYPERPATFADLSRGEQATVRAAAELMAAERNLAAPIPRRARVVTITAEPEHAGKSLAERRIVPSWVNGWRSRNVGD